MYVLLLLHVKQQGSRHLDLNQTTQPPPPMDRECAEEEQPFNSNWTQIKAQRTLSRGEPTIVDVLVSTNKIHLKYDRRDASLVSDFWWMGMESLGFVPFYCDTDGTETTTNNLLFMLNKWSWMSLWQRWHHLETRSQVVNITPSKYKGI